MKRAILVLAGIVIGIYYPVVALANSNSDRHAQVFDTVWAGGGCSDGSAGATPTSSGGTNVFLLGDSILDGVYTQSPHNLKQDLTAGGWTSTADASDSRALDLHGGTGPGTQQPGLQAIKTDSSDIASADVVVVELGTNNSGSASQFKTQIDTAIDEIKKTAGVQSDLKIYWVNLFSKGVVSGYSDAYNNAIQSESSTKGYSVIDTTGSNIDLSPDNVHPSSAGYKTLSTTISSAVGQAGSSAGSVSAGGCCPSAVTASGTIGAGVGKGMTSSAQKTFQQIMIAAGQKFNVDPNFIAAFYYAENAPTGDSTNNADSSHAPPQTGDGNWREPAPPYGKGGPYPAPNGFSATGPFQFINSTWATDGQDGNGDGVKDVNDLTDAAFAAAYLLSQNGAKVGSSDADLTKAAEAYNHSSVYAQSVLNTFHYVTGHGSASVSGGSCPTSATGQLKDPMRDVRKSSDFARERIDEGVDYTGTGPVYAVGSGRVIGVFTPSHPGIWWKSDGGNAVVYTLDDNPDNGAAGGKTIYFAEYCPPTVASGDTITSDTVICKMAGGQVETGWALSDGTDEPAAGPQGYGTTYLDGTAMAYGRNFSDFLGSIGAPEGVLSQSTNPSVVGGSLPNGWPTWK